MSSFVVRGAAAVEAMLGSGRVGAGGWSGLGNGGGVAAVVGLGALPVLLGLRSSGLAAERVLRRSTSSQNTRACLVCG